MYTLYSGGPYRQRNGSVVTSSSTDINGGAAKNMARSETLTRSNWKTGNPEIPTLVVANKLGPADVKDGMPGGLIFDGVSNDGGFFKISYSSASVIVNVDDLISVNDDGGPLTDNGVTRWYKVIRKTGTASEGSFTISCPYTDEPIYDLLEITIQNGTYNQNASENFIMKKNDARVHNTIKDKLSSGAADYGRSKIHDVKNVFTPKIATAIRAGEYNIVSGTFTYPIVVTQDYNNMSINGNGYPDDETRAIVSGYGVGGELTYSQQRIPATGQYDRRTT